MRIIFWVLFVGILGHFKAQGQTNDITYDKGIKYTFERYSSSKTTGISQGALLDIYTTSEDTSISYRGNLISASKSTITINCMFFGKYFEATDNDFIEEKNYFGDKVIEIPFETVDYIERYNGKPSVPASVASMGATSAVFAPLFCINITMPIASM
jgi:hypothetical protein